MCRQLVFLLLFPALAFGQLINPHEMPFGAYSSQHATTQSIFCDTCLDVIHEVLGFNQFTTGGFDTVQAGRFASHGIFPHPYGVFFTPSFYTQPQQKYDHASYFISHPESTFYYAGFTYTQGAVREDSFWAYKGSLYMLDNLRLGLTNRMTWLADAQLRYSPCLDILIKKQGADDSAIVGIFTVENESFTQNKIRLIDTIYVYDLPDNVETHFALQNYLTGQNYFVVDTLPPSEKAYSVRFRFQTANACSVFVDYFKLHCQYGNLLIEQNLYRTDIIDSTGNPGYDGKILGWMLKDTPQAHNYRPNAYIEDVIKTAMDAFGWDNPVRGHPWFNFGSKYSYKDYVRIAKPEQLWVYCYPTERTTTYTGYSAVYGAAWQSNLNMSVVEPCDSVRSIISYSDSTKSWVYTPQFWFCDSLDAESPCYAGEQRRRLTRSELRCETFMGLCYQPVGLVLWKYDTILDAVPPVETNRGIIDEYGNPRPGMYDAVENDINPYIKAIDSIYLDLTWQRAYPYHEGNSEYLPPAEAFVKSISAVSNASAPNPDLGWFHVGEFDDGEAYYAMIVNRACSRGPSDSTEAPSITATIRFDPTNLGQGNFVYVIDLAACRRTLS